VKTCLNFVCLRSIDLNLLLLGVSSFVAWSLHQYVIYGLFLLACGLFLLACGLFYVACGLFYVARGLFYVACGLFYVACGLFYVACGLPTTGKELSLPTQNHPMMLWSSCLRHGLLTMAKIV
jgi:hypothetical protein